MGQKENAVKASDLQKLRQRMADEDARTPIGDSFARTYLPTRRSTRCWCHRRTRASCGSTRCGCRIRTMPALVLKRIAGVRDGHLRGEGSLARPTYRVDAWAPDLEAAVSLGTLCSLRLAGFKGTWEDHESPVHELRVTVKFGDERDYFEEDILGGLCRHSTDYRLFYETLENTV